MNKFLLSATALVALSATAVAADLPSRIAAPSFAPPVFTWTGLYVGGSVGLVSATDKAKDPNYDTLDVSNWTSTGNGVLAGVNAGYNWQTGALVFGLEADIAASSASSSYNPFDDTDGIYTAHSKLDGLGTVRARVGYAVDRALFYVTGGLAYGHVKNTATYTPSTIGAFTSGWQTGWALGGGVEYAMTQNWTVRAEALYADLGSKNVAVNDASGYKVTFKDTAVVGRAGVNYKF